MVVSLVLLFLAYCWVMNPFNETFSYCVERKASKDGFVGTYDQAVEVYRSNCK